MRRIAIRWPVVFLAAATLACLTSPALLPSSPSSSAPVAPTRTPASAEPVSTLPPGGFEATDLAELYTRVNPGVVTVYIYGGPPHDSSVPIGQGSGFVIDGDGRIITNRHVVEGGDQIEVDFPSGLKTWAELIGTDPDSDLALLDVEVPADQLAPLTLGDSEQVRVGDLVVAIGNPFGLTGTMTLGVVSAIGRTLDSERAAPGGEAFFTAGDIIQTDAALNPGNSGGPLLNMRGEVIGVNRAILTESFTVSGDAASSGVGFAIPINIVRRVVPSLLDRGAHDYPYLGITSLSDEAWTLKTLEALGLPPDAVGAYVTCVTPRGPADEAGVIGAGPCNGPDIRAGGDLIIAIDGTPVRNFADLLSYLIRNTEVGQEVVLTVLRQGEEVDLTLTIAARP
ncbi:MAG TPA: trypsin-like peptidase domain-containing protein [Anaerolineales bacterium]|nr:trypsin-like peptidase domain-containing protein [Anaerolineales bacterium]